MDKSNCQCYHYYDEFMHTFQITVISDGSENNTFIINAKKQGEVQCINLRCCLLDIV